MSYETLIYAMSEGIAEIRLNRPHRLNAVTATLYAELNDALTRAEADPDARVVLLTGEGRAFCVGADLKEHKAGRTAFDRRQYLQGEQQVCKRLLLLKKPVIAAVNGFALGAGAEMAMASDFILMAESAQIGLPEISIGNFLGGGVTWLLPRLVGLAKARELVFLGERIKGDEAVRIGLANRVLPDEGFVAAAREFAARVASKAPLSMQLAKEQLNMAAERGLDAALTAELEGMTFVATTRDWQEGVDAFAEKRTPVFKGE
ncbi:enoyl-CoA hydratase/isomerase family protein [Parazoarcus communis]|uniref:Enoyl-CoA hydratase/isomerase family protein n=1 Tax=Parazoarcus communis SWub3 = DSM 12120 TaxID=1121029 RepID=A0A323UQ35_9RHOO|nr:enoyl-CoA hydratase/isomerase family protein [Parazoarcus communis]NMG72097.1 enoyl-CoA hydratase/isomerase family protein [Parazoarcus communis SWub3 = DSM 12120]PZA14539.1 enoyl-CoA hydratase/isomerase family protein [Azoarcus communis] [Parazoarcus communis SWub3 = DSM 12120]